jgi:purine-binding chemotaxis protein CheW
MSDVAQLVVFRLDAQRYALALAAVERIVSAVEISPLPNAPAIVLGLVNVSGRVLPVLNLRRRLRLPERDVGPADQFLIARTNQRTVILVIDEAQAVVQPPADGVTPALQLVPGLEQIQGVVTLPDGLVLIHDLETFLALDEARALDEALSAEVAHDA